MGKIASAYIRTNIEELKDLPPPDEKWKFRDVTISQSTLHSLIEHELIEEVDKHRISGGSNLKVWRTLPYTWKKIRSYKE
jgi:hypothetical protein